MTRLRITCAGLAMVLMACAMTDPSQVRKGETHRDLGTVYLNKGEVERAIVEYRLAVEANERDSETHFALGEAYRRKGEFIAAEQHLRRSLELDPEKHDARLNLGVIYMQQKRWPEAIVENQILVEEPTFLMPARALVNLGWAQYNAHDTDGAEVSLKRAVAIDPANYQAQVNLAIVLYETGDLVESVRHFERALDILEHRPGEMFGFAEAEIRFRAAMAHVRLGQRERAIQQLEAASVQGGETEWGKKSRDYIAVLQ